MAKFVVNGRSEDAICRRQGQEAAYRSSKLIDELKRWGELITAWGGLAQILMESIDI
jgi:hypothetical protein